MQRRPKEKKSDDNVVVVVVVVVEGVRDAILNQSNTKRMALSSGVQVRTNKTDPNQNTHTLHPYHPFDKQKVEL